MRGLDARRASVGVAWLIVLTHPGAPVSPFREGCAPKVFEETTDRKEIVRLQRWVDDGHEPWRMDNPELVAHQKLMDLASSVKGFGAHRGSPDRVVVRGSYAVIVYRSELGDKAYRVTLRKFTWLVPIAGKLKWVIWSPTKVEILNCPAHGGGAVEAPPLGSR